MLGDPAAAEITITQGEYESGMLVVRGETTQPHQRITLDDRFVARTDRNKRFLFKVRYAPRDCLVEIKAGIESRVAYIANCEPAGAASP
jgi:hypothetical protein